MHSYFWIGRYHLRKGNIDVAKRWKEKVISLAERGIPVPEETSVQTLEQIVSAPANEPAEPGQTLGWINRLFKRNK
jgi:hypothetical protein